MLRIKKIADVLKKIILSPDYRFLLKASRGLYNGLSDEEFLRRKYKAKLGVDLNLDNPRTFNEKLQWLKLYDRKEIYTTMVDKYEVKIYVADLIGEEYVIPTLGVCDSFDEIDFSGLPNQFVLKCTHDSGGLVIVKDKEKLDIEKARRKINNSLKKNYFYVGREWPYKNVKPRIIVEQYMEDSQIAKSQDTDLIDYKFYCFNGEPEYCQVISDRRSEEKIDFYDMNWELQKFTRLHVPNNPFPHKDGGVSRPVCFEQMKNIAKVLSKDIPFVRIDFYEVSGKLYFGEITFYPASGFSEFEPYKWDYRLGDMIRLPEVETNR